MWPKDYPKSKSLRQVSHREIPIYNNRKLILHIQRLHRFDDWCCKRNLSVASLRNKCHLFVSPISLSQEDKKYLIFLRWIKRLSSNMGNSSLSNETNKRYSNNTKSYFGCWQKCPNPDLLGLFYPGGKRVDTESHQALDQLVRQSTAVSLAKTVSATSPGTGKWKDQLDHINHHLNGNSYSQTKKFYKILISICPIEFGVLGYVRRTSSWGDRICKSYRK